MQANRAPRSTYVVLSGSAGSPATLSELYRLGIWMCSKVAPRHLHTRNTRDNAWPKRVVQLFSIVATLLGSFMLSAIHAAEPQLDTNTGLTLSVGQSVLVSSLTLSASDAESAPGAIFFELQLPPAGGRVVLSGNTLAVGERFTQQDLLDGLVLYRQDRATTDSDGFVLQVVDEDDERSAVFVVAVTVDRSPPVLDLQRSTFNWQENDPEVILVPDATVTDADSANFAGGFLRVVTVNGAQSGDRIRFLDGGGVVVSDDIQVDGTVVGSVSGGLDGAEVVVQWNAAATPSIAQRVLRRLTFVHLGENPSAIRDIQFAIQDNTARVSSTESLIVSVMAVNDPTQVTQLDQMIIPSVVTPVRLLLEDVDSAVVSLAVATAASQTSVTISQPAVNIIEGSAVVTLNCLAATGSAGTDALVISIDDGTSSQQILINVVIHQATTDQPWWVNDPPVQSRAGQTLSLNAQLRWATALPSLNELDWRLLGDVPTGTTISVSPGSDATTADVLISWPADAEPQWWSGGLLVRSSVEAVAAFQPWLIALEAEITTQLGDG